MVQRRKTAGDPGDWNEVEAGNVSVGSHAGGGGTGLSAHASKPFRRGLDRIASLAIGIPVFVESCAD